MDLGLEDFKQLLFDLYLAQRENAELRGLLAQKREETGEPGGEVLDGH